eukprot:1491-Rhodomonas_salina.1
MTYTAYLRGVLSEVGAQQVGMSEAVLHMSEAQLDHMVPSRPSLPSPTRSYPLLPMPRTKL